MATLQKARRSKPIYRTQLERAQRRPGRELLRFPLCHPKAKEQIAKLAPLYHLYYWANGMVTVHKKYKPRSPGWDRAGRAVR